MKRMIVALCMWAFVASAFAQTNPSFPSQLQSAFEEYRTARLQNFNDANLDTLKMQMNDRVQCVHMGRQECARMIELHAVTGADHSGDTPTAQAFLQAKEIAKAAYRARIAGASKEQIESAKKLYAAWLTELETFATYDGPPLDFDQTPAAVAYTQAANEYKIDVGD